MQSLYTFAKIFAARLIHGIDEHRHMALHMASISFTRTR
jgi:hypothetical protein